MTKKIVLDTSIITNGQIIKQIQSGTIKSCEIIVPFSVLDELQSQASQKKEEGFVGLEEIKKLHTISPENGIQVKFEGKRPNLDDIQLSNRGRIDAIITDVARQNNAVLYTSDYVQAMAAQAQGVEVKYLKSELKDEKLEFMRFFDSETMSVHLKVGLRPLAKRGKPGAFKLVEIEDNVLSAEHLNAITTQILEASKINDSGNNNIEISKPGALVIQFGDYRIAITRPPFSEAHELTLVHPIVRLSLEQYKVSDKLMSRFGQRAEGILISGPPGSGKSTLASSLADFYHNLGKIVKTFESPRDLQVNPGITQYTRLEGSFQNSADILLLVRPDYTIFDEVRRPEDFGIFSDLRLTGVGMVGVVHANSPIDAIQRFIGKIELGIIPSVLDTVVFVKDGIISKVYDLELKVKVPSGMTEPDLARPVIEIRDFDDQTLEYEIYTFGEENVIVPVSRNTTPDSGIRKLAQQKALEVFRRFDPNVDVEILSENNIRVRVDKQYIPSVIGRGGSKINDLEKMLKVHIDVVPMDDGASHRSRQGFPSSEFELPYSFSESKSSLLFSVDRQHILKHVDVFVNEKHITSERINKKGQIKIPKRSEAARRLMKSASAQNDIGIFLKKF